MEETFSVDLNDLKEGLFSVSANHLEKVIRHSEDFFTPPNLLIPQITSAE